jgi:uncharacterized OB-fold protein
MTATTALDWLVTDELAPATDGSLAPLYDASRGGSLAMPFCGVCDQALELEQVVCDTCGASVRWKVVEPEGVVHAVTTVHRLEPGLIRAAAPYHVVDVELNSGQRVVMTTDRPVTMPPGIGEQVRVTFRTVGGVAVPAVATNAPGHHDEEAPR